MTQRLPLVVILGATGSGKTKLSLELAKKFGGEIISADSMQLYKGLDIITAKATKDEQQVAPHNFLDILEPHETQFTVVDFRNKAVPLIDELLSKSTIPIIVGGTNYYIESLLWKILVEEPGTSIKSTSCMKRDNEYTKLSNSELYQQLQHLDPEMARRLHPNNKRKILRSLEVLKQNGRKHSDILKEQQSEQGGSSLGGPLRYPDALIFWLQCNQEVLDERLNSRVDLMVQQGLLQELTEFHKCYNEERVKTNIFPDYTKGIFQSIGLKEFHKYLMLSPEERSTEVGKCFLQSGIDELKMATRRYSRKQKKWVTNRLLSISDRQVPPVYGLDVTNVSDWEKNVTIPSVNIVESYISNLLCEYQPLPQIDKPVYPNSADSMFFCDVCERVFVGTLQWAVHQKSHKHKLVLERKRRLKNSANSERDAKRLHYPSIIAFGLLLCTFCLLL